jgi:rRNA maturation endonuclease Nob1
MKINIDSYEIETEKNIQIIKESNNLIIVCKHCKKEFEVPKNLDEGEEHPDHCQECPSDPDLMQK